MEDRTKLAKMALLQKLFPSTANLLACPTDIFVHSLSNSVFWKERYE